VGVDYWDACPRPEDPLSESTVQQLVVFSLAGEEYALPITHVHEIIRYAEPRSVASETPWISGVISLRGRIVPVYDLATRLGVERERPEHAKIVIVEAADDLAGLVVDDVEEVLTVGDDAIDGVPGSSSEAVEAIAKLGDRLIVLLGVDGLLAGGEIDLDAAFAAAAAEPVG
jgi:purine-binding chemotaxis protein CheW